MGYKLLKLCSYINWPIACRITLSVGSQWHVHVCSLALESFCIGLSKIIFNESSLLGVITNF